MDKLCLLCYTDVGMDCIRHTGYAWFLSEEELMEFVQKKSERTCFEVDFAIKIKSYQKIID